jgi:hypothetical protein
MTANGPWPPGKRPAKAPLSAPDAQHRVVEQFARHVAEQTEAIWRGDARSGNKHARKYGAAFDKLRVRDRLPGRLPRRSSRIPQGLASGAATSGPQSASVLTTTARRAASIGLAT